MSPEARAAYIVACIREGGSMYPEDAEKFLAEHDAHRRDEVRREAFAEAAEVAVRAARGCWHDERGQYAASVAAGVAKELHRMADATPAGKDTGAGTQPPVAEPTQSAPGFFQPGRTYCINDGVDRADFLGWIFRAEHIGHHDGKRVAFGYLTNRHPDASWNPHFEGDESWAAGWDDITAEPSGRFPSFDASGGAS